MTERDLQLDSIWDDMTEEQRRDRIPTWLSHLAAFKWHCLTAAQAQRIEELWDWSF